MDRAQLLQRRQQIRAAGSTGKRAKQSPRPTSAVDPAETTDSGGGSIPTKDKLLKKKPKRAADADVTHAALLVRQVLQRPLYGDVEAYLKGVTKHELFQQLLHVASYSQTVKTNSADVCGALEAELATQQCRFNACASDLVNIDSSMHKLESDNTELLHRLTLADEAYKSLVAWIRGNEDKWREAEETRLQQRPLIDKLSNSLSARERELEKASLELQKAYEFIEALQSQNAELRNQTQLLQMTTDRAESELKRQCDENKSLGWELQQKTIELEQMETNVDSLKNQVVTLHGQIQLEVLSKQSAVQERDSILRQYQQEREDWKFAEQNRDERDRRQTQESRSAALEIRQLKQAVLRMRTDWENEKLQCEKAQANAHQLSAVVDECKGTIKDLQAELRNTKMMLSEEESGRANNQKALETAYRDLQILQRSLREQESAKLAAESEVEALTQRYSRMYRGMGTALCRISLIRRDHLAGLQGRDAPRLLPKHWQQPIEDTA